MPPEAARELREWLHTHFTTHRGSQGGVLWELGAFDGETDSLTRGFLENPEGGWGGLLVEGNCTNYAKAHKLYDGAGNVIVLHAVLGTRDTVAEWWDDGGFQESTLLHAHMKDSVARHADTLPSNYTKKTTGVLSIKTVWDWWNSQGYVAPDLVVCDLEGVSSEVARGLVMAGCRPELVVIESAQPALLDDLGYYATRWFAPDVVFARR